MVNRETILEWENIILKEALIMSSESCEILLNDFNELLKQFEKTNTPSALKETISELFSRTESLKKSNYILVNRMIGEEN